MSSTFRPTLIPTLFTIPSLIILLILGGWQISRLIEKNAYIAEIEAASQAPAVALPVSEKSLDRLRFRPFIVEGEYLHDKEIHLYTGKYQSSYGAGYHIITPLRIKDSEDILMVNRGFIPEAFKDPNTRKEMLVSGLQRLEGLVIEGQERAWFTPENDINKNIWIWMDLKGMQALVGQKILPYLLLKIRDNDEQGAYPIASDGKFEIRNDHLEYAITWFSFAIILTVIYIVYHRENIT